MHVRMFAIFHLPISFKFQNAHATQLQLPRNLLSLDKAEAVSCLPLGWNKNIDTADSEMNSGGHSGGHSPVRFLIYHLTLGIRGLGVELTSRNNTTSRQHGSDSGATTLPGRRHLQQRSTGVEMCEEVEAKLQVRKLGSFTTTSSHQSRTNPTAAMCVNMMQRNQRWG